MDGPKIILLPLSSRGVATFWNCRSDSDRYRSHNPSGRESDAPRDPYGQNGFVNSRNRFGILKRAHFRGVEALSFIRSLLSEPKMALVESRVLIPNGRLLTSSFVFFGVQGQHPKPPNKLHQIHLIRDTFRQVGVSSVGCPS